MLAASSATESLAAVAATALTSFALVARVFSAAVPGFSLMLLLPDASATVDLGVECIDALFGAVPKPCTDGTALAACTFTADAIN
jgi:hypothetical protein